jgi:hypothetical protein
MAQGCSIVLQSIDATHEEGAADRRFLRIDE